MVNVKKSQKKYFYHEEVNKNGETTFEFRLVFTHRNFSRCRHCFKHPVERFQITHYIATIKLFFTFDKNRLLFHILTAQHYPSFRTTAPLYCNQFIAGYAYLFMLHVRRCYGLQCTRFPFTQNTPK